MPDNEFETAQSQDAEVIIYSDASRQDESLDIDISKSDEVLLDTQPDPLPTEVSNEEITEEKTEKNELLDGINEISSRITSLEKLFETKIMRGQHEEKIVDQMHRDLQKYKEDMYSQLVRPILLDMIEIRDSILRVAAAHLSKPDAEQGIPVKTFAMYASDVQELLEKNSIEIYKSEEGTDFIPIRQRAIKKTATDDKSLHGKVAESLSDGYSYNGKIISAEKVVVYYYEQPQEQAVENQEEERQNG